MTEEGMSDVERERRVMSVLDRWGVRSKHGEWTDEETQRSCAREVIIAAAGVLGGVPGEKVTVDRDELFRLGQTLGQDPSWYGIARTLIDLSGIDPETGKPIAALGGDGGTRPKGTQ